MKGLFKTTLELLATGFRIGTIPYAPGTLASAAAGLIFYFFITSYFSFIGFLFFLIFSYFIGEKLYEVTMGSEKDAQRFVWDEFTGMWISCFPLFFFDNQLDWMLISFLIFRYLDIRKPGLIGRIDRKQSSRAVMLDDALSGLITAFLVTAIYLLFIFSN